MSQKIFIKNQLYRLDSADLIQSSGEGMVFALGHTAVKLYHHPTAAQQDKLRHWFKAGWRTHLPRAVLAPCAPVHDEAGELIGLQMPRLPAASQPVRQLSRAGFWQEHGLTTRAVVGLLQRLHQMLFRIHQLQIVVGDLNDTNIFLNLTGGKDAELFWIDADSFQFDIFPCPVAMLPFLDPRLFHVTDFGQRPYFTPLTDWYAFAVLLIKSLLQVHPYGGVHRRHKSLQARAAAGVSIFNSQVQLPPQSRPPDTLSDDLLHHLHSIFERGERKPPPLQLLANYAQALQTCSQCRLAYPVSRPGCPACRHQSPGPIPSRPRRGLRSVLQVDGFIEAVFGQPNGRLLVIYRHQDEYRLLRAGVGGPIGEMVLFSGSAGYRFGAFTRPDGQDYLVVNPPNRPQLLLLDIHQNKPEQVTLLETAFFRDTAVFCTTPNFLFRISGGWILRGTVQPQGYLEEAVGTAHRAQSWLTGDPLGNNLAGYHRIFAEHRFFFISADGTERPLLLPPVPTGSHIIKARLRFTPNQIAAAVSLAGGGPSKTQVQVFDQQGRWQQRYDLAEDNWESALNHWPLVGPNIEPFPHTLEPEDQLHYHPTGWLIQQPHSLKLMPKVDLT